MPETRANELTIADVARAAGVSVSTVSRILNGKQDVASETRTRVQQVIHDLGYSPHIHAQRLRAGKTRNIALVFPIKYPGSMPFNPLDMDFIIGGAAAAGDHEYFFNLFTADVTKQSLLKFYRSAQVDGLVLMQIHLQDWRVELLRQNSFPFAMIGHCDDNTGLSYIDIDFQAAVNVAFDHLVRLGHQRIAFLGHRSQLRESGYGPAIRSWRGYQEAVQTHHLPEIYREVNADGKEVSDATLALLEEQPHLTGIVTTHSYAALNIVQTLTQRGKHIPEDVSVVTVTAERIAKLSTPPLTNVGFPSYEMGYRAVEMLTRILDGTQREPEQILIAPQLVIRDSTTLAG